MNVQWQFYDKYWQDYDKSGNQTMEQFYQQYLKNENGTKTRAVHSGDWEYCVNFGSMKQINVQKPNHRKRKIRRVELQN